MRISEDAQRRVHTAAAELGYRPNQTARSLRTHVTRTIGLISDTIATTQFAGEVIHGALDTALEHGYLLLVAETSGDPGIEKKLVDEMLDRQVDAVIYALMYTKPGQPPDALSSLPVVLLNGTEDCFDGPRVLPDEYSAGRAAARALVDAGHAEAIYSLGGRHLTSEAPNGVYAGRQRMAGVDEVLAEVGTAIAGSYECAWEPEHGYAGMLSLLDGGHRPKALVCLNDRLALGAYQALRDRGLRVPDDVSVVSFDDSDLASWLRPALTSVALPQYELGKTAVSTLLDGNRQRRLVTVPMPLRSRDSIQPPRVP